MNQDTAKLLVESAQAGDAKAFESLVEHYYSMVHGLAYSQVSDWAAADDLTQDVFLVAWTNLHRLRAPQAFLVWLRRIARNASLNWIRARDYRRKLAERQTQLGSAEISVEPDPAAAAARKECLENLGEALSALSPKLRQAMILFYIEGETAAAGAEALGINVDTMKKRLRLGRAKMQRYYAEHSVDNLEQLLPHRPKKKIEQIMAGLAIGPVLPEWGAIAANPGPAIWAHHWASATSPLKAAKAATAVFTHTLTAIGSTAISALLVLSGAAAATAFLVLGPMTNETAATAASPVIIQASDDQPTLAAATSLTTIDGAVTGRWLIVQNAIPAAQPGKKGLQPGDRILSLDGRPIADLLDAQGQGVLGGVPGAQVRVTYLAKDNDTPQTAAVLWPYEPNRFGQNTEPSR